MMYLLFSFEYFMRLLVPLYSPGLETLKTAPGEIGNFLFLPLGLVMLWLSLRPRKASQARQYLPPDSSGGGGR